MTGFSVRPGHWLDEQVFRVVYSVGLRLRLLRLVLCRRDRIPVLVMLALETSDGETAALLDQEVRTADPGSLV